MKIIFWKPTFPKDETSFIITLRCVYFKRYISWKSNHESEGVTRACGQSNKSWRHVPGPSSLTERTLIYSLLDFELMWTSSFRMTHLSFRMTHLTGRSVAIISCLFYYCILGLWGENTCLFSSHEFRLRTFQIDTPIAVCTIIFKLKLLISIMHFITYLTT